MKYLVLLFVLWCTVCRAQDGPIKVHLNSGEVISTRYVYVSQGGGFSRAFVRVSKSSKEKILIHDVDHIEGPDGDGKYRYVRPIEWRLSTIWAERTFESDRITMYYVGIVDGSFGSGGMRWKYYQYTKDDGPLTKLTLGNVKRDVADNVESLAYVKKSTANSVVQGLLYTAGAALVISSAVTELGPVNEPGQVPPPGSDDGYKIPVQFIAGVVCLTVPLLLKPSKQKNLVEALEVYK